MWRRASVYDKIAFVGTFLACAYLGWHVVGRVIMG